MSFLKVIFAISLLTFVLSFFVFVINTGANYHETNISKSLFAMLASFIVLLGCGLVYLGAWIK